MSADHPRRGRRLTSADRIELINEHRDWWDLPLLPYDLSIEEIRKHEQRIDRNAPYGNNPWPEEPAL